jgi:hypothetical protein
MFAQMARSAQRSRSEALVRVDPELCVCEVSSGPGCALGLLGTGSVTLLHGSASLFGLGLVQGRAQQIRAPRWAEHAAMPLSIEGDSVVRFARDGAGQRECNVPVLDSVVHIGTLSIVMD